MTEIAQAIHGLEAPLWGIFVILGLMLLFKNMGSKSL